MERAMKPYNYVEEAWEDRFQIRKERPASRFATGFAFGVAVTGALLLFGATSAAIGL
jgi:hypothetical protein